MREPADVRGAGRVPVDWRHPPARPVLAMIPSAFLCLMLAVFLLATVWNTAFVVRRSRGWQRALAIPSGLLVAIGACGFFGAAVPGIGVLDSLLPPSFEWPGRVNDALVDSSGRHFVLLTGPGRIRVYDANWRLLNAWTVPGASRLRSVDSTEL